MAIQLRCVDHKSEVWSLDLGGEAVVVRDAAGASVGEFTIQAAAGHFQLPSFSQSIKYLGITLDATVYRFDVSKDDLRQIKALINRSILSAGPQAIRSVRNRAIRDTLGGAACAVGGVVLSVVSYLSAANNANKRYTITSGLVVFGLIMFGKGVYGFRQYGQVKRISDGT
jgi:hypothetical protein